MSPYGHNIESEVEMSRTKKCEPGELRAEMARHGVTRREISEHLGLSYSYVKKIVAGIRDAEGRRGQIMQYLAERPRIKKDMRGIS